MQRIRQFIFTRFLCGWGVVIILNLSVDAPDLYDEWVPEDLTYNDIESFIEWALEDVLQIKNAIPEDDDNDLNSPVKFGKHIDFFYEPHHATDFPLSVEPFFEPERNFDDHSFAEQSALDELIQPPEA